MVIPNLYLFLHPGKTPDIPVAPGSFAADRVSQQSEHLPDKVDADDLDALYRFHAA